MSLWRWRPPPRRRRRRRLRRRRRVLPPPRLLLRRRRLRPRSRRCSVLGRGIAVHRLFARLVYPSPNSALASLLPCHSLCRACQRICFSRLVVFPSRVFCENRARYEHKKAQGALPPSVGLRLGAPRHTDSDTAAARAPRESCLAAPLVYNSRRRPPCPWPPGGRPFPRRTLFTMRWARAPLCPRAAQSPRPAPPPRRPGGTRRRRRGRAARGRRRRGRAWHRAVSSGRGRRRRGRRRSGATGRRGTRGRGETSPVPPR
mmetsp:Transcript_9370/g.28094  ORF Transcript_9370/g.28094 Transcript_9370/m.28094 type:complete len:259 (-) Transcript_9370:505-1281(-)